MADMEVMHSLPDFFGIRVLVLGSFSRSLMMQLSQRAKTVTVVGRSRETVKDNRDKYKQFKGLSFVWDTDASLDFPNGSFDMAMSVSYYEDDTDEKISQILEKILRWIVPGGKYFLLEPSASLNPIPSKRTDVFVPRTHTQYCHIILNSKTEEAIFQVVRGGNLLNYTDISSRRNCVYFVAEKSERETSDSQDALMDIRYSQAFIFKLEWIFGHTWVSTGGEGTTRDFCGRFGLRQNQRVLDVGCGTGGSAFFMARHYGVHVHGVDISTNMINVAIDRLGQCETRLRDKIQFEIRDIMEADYDDNSFDVVYSRDVILHIHEKSQVFAKLYRWLKPGGILFITDYCQGTGESTQDYLDYEKKACSAFVTVASYGSSLRQAGFKNVKEEDLADRFYAIQKEEQEAFLPTKETFVNDYSQLEFDELAIICANKLIWVKNRQFTWGAFTATK